MVKLIWNERNMTTPVIITETGIIPTTCEFMDQLSVQTACRYLNENLPYEKAEAMLLIEVDGPSADQVEWQAEEIGEACLKRGAIEVYVADNAMTQERVWKIRRNIYEAFWELTFSPL